MSGVGSKLFLSIPSLVKHIQCPYMSLHLLFQSFLLLASSIQEVPWNVHPFPPSNMTRNQLSEGNKLMTYNGQKYALAQLL